MKTYELTYIITSANASQEAEKTITEVASFIQGKEGMILHSHKTTPQTLSYTIKKQHSGYFATEVFQIAEEKISPLREMLSGQKDILRHIILIKKPQKEVKNRRIRRPIAQDISSDFVKVAEDKKKGEKVQMEEIDKKLDEILSE